MFFPENFLQHPCVNKNKRSFFKKILCYVMKCNFSERKVEIVKACNIVHLDINFRDLP